MAAFTTIPALPTPFALSDWQRYQANWNTAKSHYVKIKDALSR